MTVPAAATAVYVLSVIALSACALKQTQGSCPSAIARGELQSAGDEFVLGGFLDYETPATSTEPAKVFRCTAQFEFFSKDGSQDAANHVRAWTSRHCSSERHKTAVLAKIQVFLQSVASDGFSFRPGYETLVVEDEIIAARSGLDAFLKTKAYSNEAKRALQAGFEFNLQHLDDASIAGCIDERVADAAGSASKNQSVCANWRDLSLLEFRVTGPMSAYLRGRAKSFAAQFKKAKETRLMQLSQKDRETLNLEEWVQKFKDLQNARRMSAYARVFDSYRTLCTQQTANTVAQPSLNDPAVASSDWCRDPEGFWEIAQKYYRSGKLDLKQKALDAGVVTADFKMKESVSLSEILRREEFEASENLRTRWSRFGEVLTRTPGILFTNFNVAPTSEVVSYGFYSLPLQRIAVQSALEAGRFKFKSTVLGIEYLAARDDIRVEFQKSDSGTTYSVLGLWPLLSLNGVNGEQSSGGAAVVPLPAPSSSDSEDARYQGYGFGRKSEDASSDPNARNSKDSQSASGKDCG